MGVLHPSGKVPQLVRGVLGVRVGLASLALGASGGLGGLLWRGAVLLVIGIAALWLARHARPAGPPGA